MYQSMADAESAPPPKYEAGLSSDSPPSYNSLYGQIKEARRTTEGQGEFLKKFCNIILGTIGFTIILAIFLAIPILMIVVGALNLDNCPAERMIPIWMIVSGSFAALQQLATLFDRVRRKKKGEDEDGERIDSAPAPILCCNSLLGCFNLAWFIAGCVWVYRIYAPTTDPTSVLYCNHLTYYLSFWMLTSVFIVFGLIICCTCCVMLAVGSSK